MLLQGKRILFISTAYFGYEVAIADKLRALGAHVVFYDERPSNGAWTKGLIRLNRSFLDKRIKQYYTTIWNQTQDISFDYLFIIKGEVIPIHFIHKFRLKNPRAVILYYLWDSFANNVNGVKLLDQVDRAFSFNKIDCQNHGMNFRPLFYLDDYKNISKQPSNKDNVMFVCTAHTDRYMFAKLIKRQLDVFNFSMDNYFYLQSPIVYWYKYFLEKEFKKVKYSDIRFVALDRKAVIKKLTQSRVVLDVQHPRQQGLTMRTIETLGANRKLITTNMHVKEYDFYNPDNILVIDRKNPMLDQAFLSKSFKPYTQELLNYYSLEGWIKSIFDSKTEN